MNYDCWFHDYSRTDYRGAKGGHLGRKRLKGYSLSLKAGWLAEVTAAGTFSLDAMKQHLRIDGNDEDAYLTGLLDAGASFILEQLNFPYIPSMLHADYYEFPPGREPIVLPFDQTRGEVVPRLSNILEVTYPNTAARPTIAVPFAVTIDGNMITPTVATDVWPTDYSYDSPSSVQVTLSYVNPSDMVLAPIYTALQMLVAYWYNAREAVVECRPEVLPLAFNVLIENARKHYIARN